MYLLEEALSRLWGLLHNFSCQRQSPWRLGEISRNTALLNYKYGIIYTDMWVYDSGPLCTHQMQCVGMFTALDISSILVASLSPKHCELKITLVVTSKWYFFYSLLIVHLHKVLLGTATLASALPWLIHSSWYWPIKRTFSPLCDKIFLLCFGSFTVV